ncbi:hypothetical protein [Marinicella meishanensis]|uniref:hypothetical protein n=1 Tax=Marinicella meishanensis TaxID=2873263 RepID=UPI001CC140D4|nr:hypothetical protein [Marinicella sp. NBU2979]
MHHSDTQKPIESVPSGILKKALQSAALIVGLTILFGAISYAFIKINDVVWQWSLPESLWCGLAMALAVVYYLWQRRRSAATTV